MTLAFSITFILVGYSLACLGCGYLILYLMTYRPNTNNSLSAGTELASAFILGQGVLASLWLLLALGNGFSRPIVTGFVILLALIGVIIGWRRILAFARQIIGIWHELRSDTWGWQGLAGLTILLCLAWTTSLGRPVGGDATAFYMALPKVAAASERIVPLPGYDGFSNIGLQGEMHFAALMSLQSPDAARMFVWPTILAGAVLLLALGRRAGLGRRGQWIALAALLTSSAVVWLSGDGKTDLFAVPLGLAAYYWVLQVRNGPRRLALWLTGLFSGFAIVAKISYLPVLAPGIIFLLIWEFHEDFLNPTKRKQAAIAILTGGLQIFAGVILAVIPHLIQNGLWFHNPFAPFGAGTMGWTDQVWYGANTTQRIVLTYPLALTFGSYWAQYGDISPLVLAFLPLLLLLKKPRSLVSSPLAAITAAALIGVLSWIVVRPSILAPRYILATLLLFILPAARAAEYVSKNDSKPRLLTVSLMGATGITLAAVGLYFLSIIFFPANTYHYLIGKLSECGRDSNYCDAMTAINNDALAGDRVFMATYMRYWLRPDLIQCASNQQEAGEFLQRSTMDERWDYLYQQGFRYLLADASTHRAEIDSLNLASPPPWIKPRLLFEINGTILVYKLEAVNPPVQEIKACRQINPPAWDLVTISQ